MNDLCVREPLYERVMTNAVDVIHFVQEDGEPFANLIFRHPGIYLRCLRNHNVSAAD